SGLQSSAAGVSTNTLLPFPNFRLEFIWMKKMPLEVLICYTEGLRLRY
ncbi:hypothetical protein SLA2020_343350, partial [Shorea laevis]